MNTTTTDNAAATAAGQGLITSVLQRNPLVALGAALLGPIVGLFRRRSAPTAVEKTRLEHFRSCPVTGTNPGANKDANRNHEGTKKDAPIRRIRRVPAGATLLQKGGKSHA
jgi:hypothetical protein